jgi:NAD(P)-dependent dehydrogenase (short-subunit alcohol dehydrogenase family)
VRDAVARTVSEFGSLNVLCNVAGGSTPQDGPVTDVAEAEFWRAIRIDLFGTFLCCRHGLPELARAGGGSVINMASIVAQMGIGGRDAYSAAKGGIVSLTRSMATEYAPQAIRVNAIAPGVTLTPRIKAFIESGAVAGALNDRHLLGLVEPVSVAHLAVYLASDESRQITGQILAVDSGATMR